MSECIAIEVTNIYSNLKDQTKSWLNEINKTSSEIQERKIEK